MSQNTIYLVTPWPPSTSGVADVAYSQAVLFQQLGRRVVVVTEERQPVSPHGIEFVSPDALPDHDGLANCVFLHHIGNNWRYHGFMIDLVGRYPGVVVLHDLAFVDLFVGMFMPGSAGGLYALLLRHYGEQSAKRLMLAIARGELFERRDLFLRFPLFEPLIERAKAVLVYSDFAGRGVRARNGDITVLRTAMDFVDISPPQVERHRLAGSGQVLRLASFGHLGEFKRPFDIIGALAQLPRDLTWTFRFVGLADRALVDRLKAVTPAHIADRIDYSGAVDDAVFMQEMLGTDLAVQLRWPTMGETSAVVRRCLQFGVPLIVTDTGSLAEVPDHCLRVPPVDAVGVLATHFHAFLSEPDFRNRLKDEARQVMRASDPRATAAILLRELDALAGEVRPGPPAPLVELFRKHAPHRSLLHAQRKALTALDVATDDDGSAGVVLGSERFKDYLSAGDAIFEGVSGFYPLERSARPFRWTQPNFVLPTRVVGGQHVRLDCQVFSETNLVITVANAEIVVALTPATSTVEFTVPGPAGDVRAASFAISSPATLNSLFGNGDMREAGLQFFGYQLLPSRSAPVASDPMSGWWIRRGDRRVLPDDPVLETASASGFFELSKGGEGDYRWIGQRARLQLLGDAARLRVHAGQSLRDTVVTVTVNRAKASALSRPFEFVAIDVPLAGDSGALLDIEIAVSSVVTAPEGRDLGTRFYGVELLHD